MSRRPVRRRLTVEQLEARLVFSVSIGVNAATGLHAINPDIYGVAYGSTSDLSTLGATINRYGGNPASTYNWQLNADNRGSDWFFESIPDSSSVAGERGDSFISATKAAGAQADLTIPLLDWVAKVGPNRQNLDSFSIAKYGPQQQHDPWWPDAGNGVHTNGTFVAGNDPTDAYVANSVAFEQGWVHHLVSQWGKASQGGLRYYALDNEPSIWFSSHRDVQPVGPTMDDVLNKTIAYASMIKSVDPSAKVLGPEEWGWDGYFYSGYDQQYASQHNWSSFPDRDAHGGWDYLPWYLNQLHQYQLQNGKRLLDVFSIHYYPQGGEFSDDVSASMQLLRNRSTRSLWDPNYVDQSWINDKVDLLPRLKNWVNTYYPGTQVGLTEYNWGAENHMNGATTQADILGILGKQGIALATRWTTPPTGSPVFNAMKLYRDYDGHHATFGNTSVATTVPNPDQVSAFSALRSSDGALTVMVINKNLYDPNNPGATTSATVNLSNFNSTGIVREWQLLAPNPNDMTTSSIVHQPDFNVAGNSFTVSLPMQSVTLFVLKPAQPGTVAFSSAAYDVYESAGTAIITVSRSGGSDGLVTVHYATSNGTARAGSDYSARSGTLSLNPGQTSKTFSIPITNDGIADGDETVNLTLSAVTGGGTLGTPSTAVLTIHDGSPPGPSPLFVLPSGPARAGSDASALDRSSLAVSAVAVLQVLPSSTNTKHVVGEELPSLHKGPGTRHALDQFWQMPSEPLNAGAEWE
jgi:hypothetical protein